MDEVTRACRILGLEANSSEGDIKQAYRDLVKVWHPDRFAHDERLRLIAQEKLKEINGAYKFLMTALAQNGGAFDSDTFNSPETEPPVDEAAPSLAVRRRVMVWVICGLMALLMLFAGLWLFRGRNGGVASSGETAGPLAVRATINGPRSGEGKTDWESLFDGKSVESWRGFRHQTFPEKSWVVERGTLKSVVGGESVDLVTKDEYGNFELSLEWRISPGGNSGILFHVSEEFPETHNTGPEMQVLDDDQNKDGRNPKTSAGAMYGLIAPRNKQLKPVGEWNAVRILVRDWHVEYWLNDLKVVECELGSAMLDGLIADSKFKDKPHFAREKTGHIALQHHHDEVRYRNIWVRRL